MVYFQFIHLTHWGRVTHICVSKLTTIGSDNGLSPGRRQAIIWTNAGIWLIGPLRTNFSENLIEIYAFSFRKMHLKTSFGKWRPFCLGLNVLRHGWIITSHKSHNISDKHPTMNHFVTEIILLQIAALWGYGAGALWNHLVKFCYYEYQVISVVNNITEHAWTLWGYLHMISPFGLVGSAVISCQHTTTWSLHTEGHASNVPGDQAHVSQGGTVAVTSDSGCMLRYFQMGLTGAQVHMLGSLIWKLYLYLS